MPESTAGCPLPASAGSFTDFGLHAMPFQISDSANDPEPVSYHPTATHEEAAQETSARIESVAPDGWPTL